MFINFTGETKHVPWLFDRTLVEKIVDVNEILAHRNGWVSLGLRIATTISMVSIGVYRYG